MQEQDVTNLNPEGLTNEHEMLAEHMLECDVIKFGDFKLKLHDKFPKAPLSPIYIDLRLLRRYPTLIDEAARNYFNMIKERKLKFDLIADVPTAATPIVSHISTYLEVGMISPRIDVKSHGLDSKIDGFLDIDRGKKVLLIDDVITTAESKLNTIDILRRHDFVVSDVMVLVDREQGGRDQLEKAGYQLHSITTISQLLDYYLRVNRITHDTHLQSRKKLDDLNRFMEFA